jgi:biopolymer transport protein ExbB/TolQ
MRINIENDFVAQFLALVLSTLIIHSAYTLWVRPTAEAEISAAIELGEAAPRTVAIVLKDYEQETCLILFFWALGIIGVRTRLVARQERYSSQDFLSLSTGVTILPDDTREYARRLLTLPDDQRETLTPRAMLAGLQRFGATGDIGSASDAARQVSETEGDRLDSELSMVRYIVWAIPSIGFIGTVRGIGEALSKADEAVNGNIAGVTESLGVAFNSTFVALVLSIILMFLIHHLQVRQERLVLNADEHCERRLLSHFRSYTPSTGS